MSKPVFSISVLLIALCVTVDAAAQKSRRPSAQQRLAIEVTYYRGRPPAYMLLFESPEKLNHSWYGSFEQKPDWQSSAVEPVDSVGVFGFYDKNVVTIQVRILRGKFFDVEEQVATRTAVEGDRLRITELESHGVEPFEIRVFKPTPLKTTTPSVTSKADSLEVVKVESLFHTFPVYKLTFHNRSSKDIAAIGLNVSREGRLLKSGMREGDQGQPWIKAGEQREMTEALSVKAQRVGDGYTPSAPDMQQVIVTGVVFTDGSYQGDIDAASRHLPHVVGTKVEVKRIVQTLSTLLREGAGGSAEEVSSKLSSLPYEVTADEIARLSKAFPNIEPAELHSRVELSMHTMRKDFLDEMKKESSQGDFRKWLRSTSEQYSAWLLRLDAAAY